MKKRDTINWKYIEELKKTEEFKTHWIPYGLPEIVDPFHSKYGDIEVYKKWDVPEKVVISQTINGAFYSKKSNPNIPVSPEEIIKSARECALLGPSTVHVHVRDEQGYNVLDPELFHRCIDPIRDEFPMPVYDGCMVPFQAGEWDRMVSVLSDRLLEVTPINTTACYCGDTLFAKPPHVMIEKTRLCQELGVKPQIAVYSDGDVDNADRYLIKTGLLEKPYYWIILATLPGGSPMHNPKQMVNGLMHLCELIYDIDRESIIIVCASGRASTYLAVMAMLLGLHIRVGMEDTIWEFPHKDTLIKSNAECFRKYKLMAQLLGREVADGNEYRKLIGLPAQGKAGIPAAA
jgi:3-keto-5-aminohexanoate cleavage enzyme